MFHRLLIANRGEIACRITRTAHRLGLQVIAVYSDADAGALHTAMADEAWRLPGIAAAQTYLNGAAILEIARQSGAEAVHPGYGFLSENADFAAAVEEAGLVFVGPPVAAIRAMGDKAEAKALMQNAGVPQVPGYHGQAQDPVTLAMAAERLGYPLLVKAAAGGGGRGMRVVEGAEGLEAALGAAAREAEAAFGDPRLLLERYLARPRHVEVQVFADRHGACLALSERDCSLQRRHQKVVEEAPAPALAQETRAQLHRAAVAAARAVDYVGAGTVEFLVDQEGRPYFIEMNTRLQVEHPVTEMITGLDLVEWQLRVAAGARLPLSEDQVVVSGHALEVRIYAEDPERDYLPQPGTLTRVRFPPEDAHVRIDTGIRQGTQPQVIPAAYDPMIAKLIVWDADRGQALRRLARALAATEIAGTATNLMLLRAIAADPAFAAADLDTAFLARHRARLLPDPEPASRALLVAASLALVIEEAADLARQAAGSGDPFSPWALGGSFRVNLPARRRLTLRDRLDGMHEVVLEPEGAGWRVTVGGETLEATAEALGEGRFIVEAQGQRQTLSVSRQGDQVTVFEGRGVGRLTVVDPLASSASAEAAAGGLAAPMPGRIAAVLVEEGARVARGQPLLVVEAMKMQHTLAAPLDGRVARLAARAGDQVEEGVILVVVEPE